MIDLSNLMRIHSRIMIDYLFITVRQIPQDIQASSVYSLIHNLLNQNENGLD
jgi:hypothetical protein